MTLTFNSGFMQPLVLVGGAGGTPSNNFIRSLKDARSYRLAGMTANKYDLAKADVPTRFLVPHATDKDWLPVLRSVLEDVQPDLLHVQNDAEVLAVSEARNGLDVRTFLPSEQTVRICVDKALSYDAWANAGLRVPQTMLINTPADLQAAMERWGKVWLRFKTGAFGKGSLPTDDPAFALAWLEHHKGWGQFTAAECLEPDSVTWLSIWNHGNLVVAQSRKRLYWEFANRTISGVTGITGTGVTIRDEHVDKVAQDAIHAIDAEPNGIFGVDLTYDKQGEPNPTEINIGRFFTTHHFFTRAGLNMPDIYCRLALGMPLRDMPSRIINPLPSGLAWVRGMDCEPVLTRLDLIDMHERNLQARRERLAAR